MIAPVTVLTATVPGREESLAHTIWSVNDQTVPVHQHLICSHPINDEPGMLQYVKAKNSLLPAVTTEWVAVLNDDDTWLPNHVETLLPHLDGDSDVIYSWDANGTRPRVNCNDWTRARFNRTLSVGNFIDGNCLIRLTALEKVGGFPTRCRASSPFEDWELWRQLSATGCSFRCVPVETWRYSVGDGRLSSV
jgi:hypothetical protein